MEKLCLTCLTSHSTYPVLVIDRRNRIQKVLLPKKAVDLLADMPILSDNLIELVLEYARPGEEFDFQLHMLCDKLSCGVCHNTKEKCSLLYHHESGKITACTVECPDCDRRYLPPAPEMAP